MEQVGGVMDWRGFLMPFFWLAAIAVLGVCLWLWPGPTMWAVGIIVGGAVAAAVIWSWALANSRPK